MKIRIMFLLMLLSIVVLVSCQREGFSPFDEGDDSTVKVKYTVEVLSSPGGSITPDGVISVVKGSSISFNIIENPGFKRDSIIVNEVGYPLTTNTYTIDDIASDLKIKPIFKKIEVDSFKIEVIAGPGGTITPSGSVYVKKGADLSINLNPGIWYMVDQILVDNVPYTSTTDSTFVWKNIQKESKIEFFFKKNLSFPWILNKKIFDLDTLSLKELNGSWSYYKILGDTTQRQETLVFELNRVSTYWDGVLKLEQFYEITNTNPPIFKLLGEGQQATVLLMNESRFVTGITGFESPEITGKNIYKARQ